MSDGLRARLRVRVGDFALVADLGVEGGETLALVGPNGAGKSTTIELLAGLRALDADGAGSVVLDGEVLDDPATGVFVPPERRRVGVVFQDHLLFDHLTVRSNVAFGLRASGADRRAADRRARDWLERLGLGALADRRPRELSGGQAQRVAIARTLAIEPRLLLLDEPLAALDVESRTAVRRVLKEQFATAEHPTVLISHDPADAMRLADRIAVIESGRVTQIDSPEMIRRRPASAYVAALSGTNLVEGHASDGVVTVGDGQEVPVHRLRIADAGLTGAVSCSIRPVAVSLHVDEPRGSQRNVWQTSVELVEPTGATVRVTLGAPLTLAVDVTATAADALDLHPGRAVWAAVKATEIDVAPA